LERDRAIGRLLHCGAAIRLQIDAVEIELAAGNAKPRPRLRELGIKPDGLGIKRNDLLCNFEGSGIVDCDCVQISVVGRRILGRFFRDGFLLGAGKFGVELVGDGAGYLALYAKTSSRLRL
jgi:hypothetical protein